jgi:S1-C subfamily serine protease
VKVSKLGQGKLAQIGIQQGFIVTSIDKKKVATVQDIKNALTDKTGVVVIEGYYLNGMRASYSFPL